VSCSSIEEEGDVEALILSTSFTTNVVVRMEIKSVWNSVEGVLVKEARDLSVLVRRHVAASAVPATAPNADPPRSAPPRRRDTCWSVERLWTVLLVV